MVAFSLRFYLLIVFITLEITVSLAQFLPFGGSGGGFGQNSFSSQNTNFNQNRRGFGVFGTFGGSSSTNFNQNSVQSGSSFGGPVFRESQQQTNTIDEMQARYASPYDLPPYWPKPHPYHAHASVSYHSPASPCPSNVLVSCAPQVTHVPCSNPSYLSKSIQNL